MGNLRAGLLLEAQSSSILAAAHNPGFDCSPGVDRRNPGVDHNPVAEHTFVVDHMVEVGHMLYSLLSE